MVKLLFSTYLTLISQLQSSTTNFIDTSDLDEEDGTALVSVWKSGPVRFFDPKGH